MKKIILVISFMLFASTAHAILIDRGSFAYDDGASHTGFVNLIYDDDFDITWVGDGNFAETTGFDSDGGMQWGTALTWAGGLTIGSYNDWRLPSVVVPENQLLGEMRHLYDELGGTPPNPISASSDPDLVLFPNLGDMNYWYDEDYEDALPGTAWRFLFQAGHTSAKDKSVSYRALAVRDGDVVAAEPVPEPTTIALLGIGLFGLAGAAVRRRLKKRAAGDN